MTVAVFTAAGIIVPAPLNTSNHRLMSKGRAGRQQRLLLGRAAGPGGCWQGLQPREGIRAPLRQPLLQSGKPSLGLFKKGGVHCLGAEIHTWLFILFCQTIIARLLSNSMGDTPLPFLEKRYHVYPLPVKIITVKVTGSEVASATSFKCFKVIFIKLNQQKYLPFYLFLYLFFHFICSSSLWPNC